MTVKIHHEGTNILLILLAIVIAVNLPLWLCVKPMAIAITSTVLWGILYLLVVNFFRSPLRKFEGDTHNAVVSSADGKVVTLEEVFEDEYLHCRCLQLSVFMSIFNVHANWFPVEGEVVYSAHHSGRYMGAYLPKSSTENERSTTVIRTPDGQEILVRQIAGAIARRIVTYAEKGDQATIDGYLGFIKFGSRVDIFLPLGSEPLVKIGDVVTGGVTKVAQLNPSQQNNA